MVRTHIAFCSLCIAVARPASATGPAPSVDRVCAAARRRADASPDKARLFAVASEQTDGGQIILDKPWQELASCDAFDALAERSSLYRQAFVWELPGNSLVVTLFMTSPSGDWGHFVDYCYRADGTLALTESTLNTSSSGNGPVRRIRKRRFDRWGRVMWTRTRVLDLDTRRPKVDPQFMDRDEPIFQTRQMLPFVHLLSTMPRPANPRPEADRKKL